jgi:hypothetical protein
MSGNSGADDLSAVLRALARGDSARSETARLRDVIDDVEAALSAGVSRAKVLEELHGHGFTMNLKSFESALYRIRKSRKKGQEKGHATGSVASTRRDSDLSVRKSENVEDEVPEPDTTGTPARQRREARANRYIKPEASNPLLRKKQEQKE